LCSFPLPFNLALDLSLDLTRDCILDLVLIQVLVSAATDVFCRSTQGKLSTGSQQEPSRKPRGTNQLSLPGESPPHLRTFDLKHAESARLVYSTLSCPRSTLDFRTC